MPWVGLVQLQRPGPLQSTQNALSTRREMVSQKYKRERSRDKMRPWALYQVLGRSWVLLGWVEHRLWSKCQSMASDVAAGWRDCTQTGVEVAASVRFKFGSQNSTVCSCCTFSLLLWAGHGFRYISDIYIDNELHKVQTAFSRNWSRYILCENLQTLRTDLTDLDCAIGRCPGAM